MENEKLKWVSGSLHSHGFWTDYRNLHERILAPFSLDNFAKTCMKYGRDFQAVLDIMAHQKGKNPLQENRYEDLIKTVRSNSNYEVEFFPNAEFPIETRVFFNNGEEFYIPRTQEVLTENLLAHILVLGLGKNNNIPGGLPALETLYIIKDKGGHAFINHPLVCGAFTKEQIQEYFKKGLVIGAEFNGGVTLDSKLGIYLAKKIGKTEHPPLKKENESILNLEKKVLIVSNDDSRCKWDVKRGAYTEYLISSNEKSSLTERLVASMQNEVQRGFNQTHVKRHDNYSGFYSLWYHGLCGKVSHFTQKESLPEL